MNLIEKIISSKNGKPLWGYGDFSYPKRSLISALQNKNGFGMSIIGEIRHNAPSYGEKAKWTVDQMISAYADSVQAISIFTEKNFFNGDVAWISMAKAKTDLPVLVLDFFTLPEELLIVKSHGADAVIIIADILDEVGLRKMVSYAKECGLETIVEVQDEVGVRRALSVSADIVGINNRNLWDLSQVDLNKLHRLRSLIPSKVPVIVESGISFPHDQYRYNCQADGIVIGSAFVESTDLLKCLSTFQQPNENGLCPFIWTKPAAYLPQSDCSSLTRLEECLAAEGFRIKKRYPVGKASRIALELYRQKLNRFPEEGITWYWLVAAYYDLMEKLGYGDNSEIIFFEKRDDLLSDLKRLEDIKREMRQTIDKVDLQHDFCGRSFTLNLHSFHVPDPEIDAYLHDLKIILSAACLTNDIVSYMAKREYRQEKWYQNKYEEDRR